jgi:hypothetical protein
LRWDEIDFLTTLHPMAVDASLGSRLAKPSFTTGAIDTAPVLTEQAVAILLPRQFQPFALDCLNVT